MDANIISSQRTNKNLPLTIAKLLLPLLGSGVLSVVVGYGASQYREATRDAQIKELQEQQNAMREDIVPRREHVQQWNHVEQVLNSIQTDVREIRKAQTDYLIEQRRDK